MDQRIIYEIGSKIGTCIYLGDNGVKNLFVKERHAFFKCVCGKEFTAAISKLKNGHTSSCGCLASKVLIDRNTKHGLAKRGERTKEYNIWLHMKRRCTNPKTTGFKNWGGKGVRVCDRWAKSFENFLEDIGNCPDDCRGIDRFPNKDGDYEKSNCRWATYLEQCNNTSRNVYITYGGEIKTMSEWSKILKIPYWPLRYRIVKKKLTPEQAFNQLLIT